jgi:hypothetical protein
MDAQLSTSKVDWLCRGGIRPDCLHDQLASDDVEVEASPAPQFEFEISGSRFTKLGDRMPNHELTHDIGCVPANLGEAPGRGFGFEVVEPDDAFGRLLFVVRGGDQNPSQPATGRSVDFANQWRRIVSLHPAQHKVIQTDVARRLRCGHPSQYK